jgi:DDE superfamily endonuclease
VLYLPSQVILQAVCDPRGFFLCIDVGFPGRMADAKVLRFTPLYRKAMQWFGNAGYYIYGDAAYPLRCVV